MEEDKDESRIKMENLDSKIVEKIGDSDTTKCNEKLDIKKYMSNTSSCGTSSLVNRIKKDEISIEEWDQYDTMDADDLMAEVKIEKVELENHEVMDTLDPITGAFIPNISDNTLTEDVVLNRINIENIKTEKLGESDIPANLMEDKKLQKEEIEEMVPGADSVEIYPVQLTEELDIKNEIDASSDVALERVAGKKTADQKSFNCCDCRYTTHIRRYLVTHISRSHNNAVIFSCSQCHRRYKSKRSLDYHVVKRHPNLIASVTTKMQACTICKFKTLKRTVLDDHIIQKHPTSDISFVTSKLYKCKQCPFKSTLKWKFSNHGLTHLGSPKYLKCMYCSEKYKHKSSLDDHIVKYHPYSKTLVNRTIRECKMCTFRTIGSKKKLEDHIITKHPDSVSPVTDELYECKNCPFKTTIESSLFRHFMTHLDTSPRCFTCALCDSAFNSKMALNNHFMKSHPNSIASISGECPVCTFKTTKTSKAWLDLHILQEHPDFIGPLTSKIYECKQCPFRTTMSYHFHGHVLRHVKTPSKHFSCLYCTGVYKSKSELHEHMVTSENCKLSYSRDVAVADHTYNRKHPDSMIRK